MAESRNLAASPAIQEVRAVDVRPSGTAPSVSGAPSSSAAHPLRAMVDAGSNLHLLAERIARLSERVSALDQTQHRLHDSAGRI